MKYCKKCVMPDTRPGIKFNEEGVCQACVNYEKRKYIDWDDRWEQLEQLADKYRNSNDSKYDCMIAGSSGKDSTYQVYVFKKLLKMNPLVVSVNNFSWTNTGWNNWNVTQNVFGVDVLRSCINPPTLKKMLRRGLERSIPNWIIDHALYSYPVRMATMLKVPLLVYGENVSYEYGGYQEEETPSAMNQIHNDVAKPIPFEDWCDNDLSINELACIQYPTKKEMDDAKLNPIYLSYYINWSGYENAQKMKKFGWRDLNDTNEWHRDGFAEQYDQVDTVGYLVHPWFKFVKFGHYRTTDVLSTWIREGRITRKEAVEKVLENDWKLDRKMLFDFLSFIGYTEKQFWDIVDKYANRSIIEKRDGNWRLKPNVAEALRYGREVKE